jgi:hypothetical protein
MCAQGPPLRKSNASKSYLQQHKPQHQRAKGTSNFPPLSPSPTPLPFHPAKTFPLTPPLSPNPDLQNRPLQSLRPQMHNPRDRKRRRAPPPLPIRRLESLPCHAIPNLGGTHAIIESLLGIFFLDHVPAFVGEQMNALGNDNANYEIKESMSSRVPCRTMHTWSLRVWMNG